MLLLQRCLMPFLALSLIACEQQPEFTQAEPGEHLSAGAATVRKFDQNAFSLPSANLAPSRRLDFAVGNSFFRNPWVTAPATTTARDGLGPLFNTNACQNCHIKDGRGHPPGPDAVSATSMLVRLSIPAGPEHAEVLIQHGVVAEPTYGTQMQDMANPGVAPEGKVRVTYSSVPVRFADGTVVELRKPELVISQLGYGDMHPDTRFSARIAPPMIGLGLLEAIAEEDILAGADPDDADGDGISGRPNMVWDRAQQRSVLGRFGWKAGQPNLNQQNAEAFANDMGLTSSLILTTIAPRRKQIAWPRPMAANRKSATTSSPACCSTVVIWACRHGVTSTRLTCSRARACSTRPVARSATLPVSPRRPMPPSRNWPTN